LTSTAAKVLSASRQIAFHQLLVAARKTWLLDALAETLENLDPNRIKQEISEFVPPDAQKILATAGVRDEQVFPVPIVLAAKPTLVGYYRLLLGLPQKTFYGNNTGMGRFKSMEISGNISARQQAELPEFCRTMALALADLVQQLSPRITSNDVRELPLLTIGGQFQGANNNTIGKTAARNVFMSISEIVKPHVTHRDTRKLLVQNASGRRVVIALSSDPDVCIQEEFQGDVRRKVALEIKGGSDKSNAYNRAGEAEKSHQKAKNQGFRDFWTIIYKKNLDLEKLKAGSPTTTAWFDAPQVLGREGEDWERFRNEIAGVVGIPV
jgi:hypothetical protein